MAVVIAALPPAIAGCWIAGLLGAGCWVLRCWVLNAGLLGCWVLVAGWIYPGYITQVTLTHGKFTLQPTTTGTEDTIPVS